MCDPKEPNFFSDVAWEQRDVSAEALASYRRLFSEAVGVPVIGEASVGYLESPAAPGLIRQHCGDVRILIILRNPIERVASLYEMYSRNGRPVSFEQATGSNPWLLRQCLYARNVERYISLFGSERFLWVDYEALKSSWGPTLARIQEWLGVSVIDSERPVVRNLGGMPVSRLGRGLFDRRVVSMVKRVIPRVAHNAIDRGLKKLVLRRLELTSQQVDRFRDFFLEDAHQLGNLLGFDFRAHWFGSEDSSSQDRAGPA